MTTELDFTTGQIWKYNSRSGEEQSTFTVLKVEEYINNVVVHIRIDDIKLVLPTGTTSDHIKHLPFSATALRACATELIGHTNELLDFMEGYTQWKNLFDAGKAGYWKMPVQEAVDAVSKIAGEVK
jgi:hypothetical protein